MRPQAARASPGQGAPQGRPAPGGAAGGGGAGLNAAPPRRGGGRGGGPGGGAPGPLLRSGGLRPASCALYGL